jgi:hypothetical protein
MRYARWVIHGVWAVFTIGSAVMAAQTTPIRAPATTPPTVVFHVEPNLDLGTLTIRYALQRLSDVSFGEIAGRRTVRDYPVVTVVDGQPARAAKAYAYLPGFGFALVGEDLTGLGPAWIATLTLKPLGSVRLTGIVKMDTPAANASAENRLRVVASVLPDWQCEFFGATECIVDPLTIGSVTLGADGTFSLDLPDLARDPSLAMFRTRGTFDLRVVRADGSEFVGANARMTLAVSTAYEAVALSVLGR